jgi:hypothetical protein
MASKKTRRYLGPVISVSLFDDSDEHLETHWVTTDKEARQLAAKLLGQSSLRGSYSWQPAYPSGATAYQFGGRKTCDRPLALPFVIIDRRA